MTRVKKQREEEINVQGIAALGSSTCMRKCALATFHFPTLVYYKQCTSTAAAARTNSPALQRSKLVYAALYFAFKYIRQH